MRFCLCRVMVLKLMEALSSMGIASLKDAASVVGQGDIAKAREVCSAARVDLDAELLREWLAEGAGS